MQKPPKKTQKSPHPFGHLPATYRPAIDQLSASYKKNRGCEMCPFCASHEQSGPTSSKGGGPAFLVKHAEEP